MNEPIIKWVGSKRTQAKEITSYINKEIETYYEPFLGSGAVLKYLLSNTDIKPSYIICSDLNNDLITLWKTIKDNPDLLLLSYERLWNNLISCKDINYKREYFNEIRKEFNLTKKTELFFFIMRTTTNGMPRYNKKGEFNNSFHITRNGIMPKTLAPIMYEWANLLSKNNVEFKCCSYTDIIPTENDFSYFDPPYANTKGMYYGNIDNNIFFNYLKTIKGNYAFSFDGKSGTTDNTFNVPPDIYNKHIYICNGNSSFKKIIGKDKTAMVYESLYIK